VSRQIQERTFDEAVQWLRDHGFDILEAPGTKKPVCEEVTAFSPPCEQDAVTMA